MKSNNERYTGYDPIVGFFEGPFCHLVLVDTEELDDDPWAVDPPAYTLEDADYFGAIWASPY